MKEMIDIHKDTTAHEEGCPIINKTAEWYAGWKNKCPVCDAFASVTITKEEYKNVEAPYIRMKSARDLAI